MATNTLDEQRTDLADLDELLGRLETIEPETADEAEQIAELRGRIEILMDEIEISLGIEPPAFYSPKDLDTGPKGTARCQGIVATPGRG